MIPALRRAAATLLLVLACAPAHAALHCGAPDAQGARSCKAGLAAPVVQRMVQAQEKPKWCWAAALAMILSRHGYAMPQQDIVEEIYGTPVDSGMPTTQLPHAISRDWYTPQGGVRASARFQAAHPGTMVPASSVLLVSSLERGDPVLLATQGHAVVVVELAWDEAPGGLRRITGGKVIDPLPGVGVRPLALQDLQVALLARVEVQALRPAGFISVAELSGRARAEEVVLPQ